MNLPLRKRIKAHHIFSGIGRKFLLYFVFFSILPILLISVIGFKITENIVINQNIENLNLQNEILANRLEKLFEVALYQISYENPNFLNLLQKISKAKNETGLTDTEKFDKISNYLKEKYSGSAVIGIFYILDKTGKTIYGTDSIQFGLPAQVLRMNNQALPSVRLAESNSDQKPNIILINKIRDTFTNLSGHYIISTVSKTEIEELIQSFLDSTHGDQFFLLDRISQLVYYPILPPDIKETATESSLIEKNGFIKTEDGGHILRQIKPLQVEGFYIISDVPYVNALREIIIFRHQTVLGVGSLLILLMGLAFYFSQRITIPIRQLVYAAQDIGDGLLDAPIRIPSGDEIGILAKELDQMRQNLLDYYENLEKKVELRTQELKKVQFQIMHQEKMASIGLLAAGIAHEIGNPLTSISSLTQLLKRRLKDEKNLVYLSTLMKNIDRISRIVRELVDFSRPSNFETRLTDVNKVAQAAVGIVKYDSRSKHIKFELDFQPELPKLDIVSDQLLQVFINILFNAVDAMEGHGDILRFSTKQRGNYLIFQVEDSGTGIPKSEINKIFEPFYTTKEVGKGTGLGLSVSYGIIKNFNGEIHVESKVGKGSIFKIKLPINTVEKKNEI
jgi:signal transduction histidine kinase